MREAPPSPVFLLCGRSIHIDRLDALVMKGPTGATVCSNCNSDDRWILHHVHHRNTYRRLCTTCVLKLNVTSFCPICFSLHDRPKKSALPPLVPALRGTLVCFKCNSSSHPNCVAPNTPKSPYLCPTCSNPHVKLFDFRNSNDQAIDLKASKVLLAAAMIAANSLNEAVEQARVQAERKAKEAVAARKRAKNALERVALVWMRDQERTRVSEGTAEAEISVSVSSKNGLAHKGQNFVVQVDKNGGTLVAPPPPPPGTGRLLNGVVDNIKNDKGNLRNGVQVQVENNNNGQNVNNLGRKDDNGPS